MIFPFAKEEGGYTEVNESSDSADITNEADFGGQDSTGTVFTEVESDELYAGKSDCIQEKHVDSGRI